MLVNNKTTSYLLVPEVNMDYLVTPERVLT